MQQAGGTLEALEIRDLYGAHHTTKCVQSYALVCQP